MALKRILGMPSSQRSVEQSINYVDLPEHILVPKRILGMPSSQRSVEPLINYGNYSALNI